jgi:hypothetical protein
MISIKTFSGQPFQIIHITEDDMTYNDLLKYIKIPPHPRFEEYNRELFTGDITVKPYIKLFHIAEEVNLKDIIDFDSELTIGFYFEYYHFNYLRENDMDDYGVNFGDDFNLPDTSTYDKCKTLIEENPFNIIFIPNEMMLDELCKLAFHQNSDVLQYVKNQTEEICKLAVRLNGDALKFVKEQTEEICKLAVQQNGMALQFVKEQTEEICKLAVQLNGFAIGYVNHQTEEICKLAVQQYGCSLTYIKEQTEEICKLAVQKNGIALQYVKDQTEEICKLAVQRDRDILKFVKNQTEEICKLAVQQDGYSLKYVKDPAIKHKLSNP